MDLKRTTKLGYGFLFLILAAVFSQNATAQIVIDNLTGGSSSHASTIGGGWNKHEWDIIFPAEYRGQSITGPVLYYRLYYPTAVAVNGGFTSGNDGSFIVSPVTVSTVSTTPPQTGQTDNYLVFDFTGQTLNVPANGILWFRFDWVSGDNARLDIGALGTYTTTYDQNDNVRTGGTSFAVYGDANIAMKPVPMLSPWALAALSLLIGFVVFRRYRTSA